MNRNQWPVSIGLCKNPEKLINSKTRPALEKQVAIFDKAVHGINKRGDREDIQDEGAGGEQGG